MFSAIGKFFGHEKPNIKPDEPVTESRLDAQIERERGALRNEAQSIDSNARYAARLAQMSRVLEVRRSYD